MARKHPIAKKGAAVKHIKLNAAEEPAGVIGELTAICRAQLKEIEIEVKGKKQLVHERDLLVEKTYESDCAKCRAPLLIHIRSRIDGWPACGDKSMMPKMVDAAMASDCDDCRTAVGVALVRDKSWNGEVYGVRPEPDWVQQPMTNADEICASARANRS